MPKILLFGSESGGGFTLFISEGLYDEVAVHFCISYFLLAIEILT